MRLQRRRHLRSLKRRRLERQKEQKAEFEYATKPSFYKPNINSLTSIS